MQNKSALFSETEVELAMIAKALSHPARIRILTLLADCDRCITGTLVNDLPLAQATVSQHLKILRDSGLVIGEIETPRHLLLPEQECTTESPKGLRRAFRHHMLRRGSMSAQKTQYNLQGAVQ